MYSLNIVISKIEELFTTALAGFRKELTCLMFLGCAKKRLLTSRWCHYHWSTQAG